MKKKLLITLVIFAISGMAGSLKAQEDKTKKDRDGGYIIIDHQDANFQTLVNRDVSNGFYLSFDMAFSEINDNDMIELGGRIGWVINHGFTFGLAGQAFINNVETDVFDNNAVDLSGGYGGILLEPIVMPLKPIHLSFPVIIGAGGVVSDYGWNYDSDIFHESSWYNDSDAFFIVRPGVEVELNVARFFRIGLGAYYRYLVDLDLEGYDKNALNGFSGGLSLKVGWF